MTHNYFRKHVRLCLRTTRNVPFFSGEKQHWIKLSGWEISTTYVDGKCSSFWRIETNMLDLFFIMLMPSSQYQGGQDKTVSSCLVLSVVWTELETVSLTVFGSNQYVGDWTVLSSPVCGVNASWKLGREKTKFCSHRISRLDETAKTKHVQFQNFLSPTVSTRRHLCSKHRHGRNKTKESCLLLSCEDDIFTRLDKTFRPL